MPTAVVAKIHDDIQAILKEPETAKWLRDQGLEPSYTSTQDFGQAMASERDRWAKLIAQFHVTVQ
jgi:tripartite-type tricarboxylate transporter receptor subunit TctC